MNALEAKVLADKMDASLLSDDPRLSRCVQVIHQDGTSFFYHHAFFLIHELWLFVLTEHNGTHAFNINDLSVHHQFELVMCKPEVIDASGDLLLEIECSTCKKMVPSKETTHPCDKNRNKLVDELCESCYDSWSLQFYGL
jgi:hypothetical protein